MMTDVDSTIPPGFRQTCWRGLRLLHPVDWEPAALSGPKEPAKCILVDRRVERLEMTWKIIPRPPDLQRMYERRGRSERDVPTASLSGVPGWSGLVRKAQAKTTVVAGRYFRDSHCLVQVVLFWQDRRDHDLERSVLTSIRPLSEDGARIWQAAGLKVQVPEPFELASASTRVGCVAWEFASKGRGEPGLSVARLAMPEHWLKGPLREWLGQELPKGFKALRDIRVSQGPHAADEVRSHGGSVLGKIVGRGTYRVDRAWLCETEQRVYRMSYWQKARGEVQFPADLTVHCCRREHLEGLAP